MLTFKRSICRRSLDYSSVLAGGINWNVLKLTNGRASTSHCCELRGPIDSRLASPIIMCLRERIMGAKCQDKSIVGLCLIYTWRDNLRDNVKSSRIYVWTLVTLMTLPFMMWNNTSGAIRTVLKFVLFFLICINKTCIITLLLIVYIRRY